MEAAAVLQLQEPCRKSTFRNNCLSFALKAAKTTQSRVGKLLDILPKRGAKAFQTFLDALRESHHDHLLDILDPSGAASSQRSSGVVISQPANDPRLDRFSPSDTSSSSRNTENLKHPKQASIQPSENSKQTSVQPSENPKQASVQPSENFERKPVQPVDSVKLSGKVLDEIVHVVDKIIEKKSKNCLDGFVKFKKSFIIELEEMEK